MTQFDKVKHRWPTLYSAVQCGALSFADYALADAILRQHPNANEVCASLICHLSLSSRSGHLCLQINAGKISPDPTELWTPLDEYELSNELANLLSKIHSGIESLPNDVISDAIENKLPLTPICRNNENIYFQKNWIHETTFLNNFKRLLNSKPEIMPEGFTTDEAVKSLINSKILTSQQAHAISQAIKNSLTLISGGPGTGKTYTAAYFIKVFLESHPIDQMKNCEIAVAAPTGKAAANLYKGLSGKLLNLPIKDIQPKTLHSLLGIKNSNSQNTLTADLILVDEASMIDAKLMAYLLASVKTGARLVLLGDKYQLPAVEAGSLFADMNHAMEINPEFAEQRIEFTTCLRAELKEIVTLAELINDGKASNVLKMLDDNNQAVSRLKINGTDQRRIRNTIVENSSSLFPNPCLSKSSISQLFDGYNQFRILTPMRQGSLGLEELNRIFFSEACKKVPHNEYIVSPIVISSNDYRLNLFNGEGGLLIRQNKNCDFYKTGDKDYALFPDSASPDGFRRISAILLPKFEYAYCLSVHKSQGSEFDKVLLLLPEGVESFGREMLYTAVTRAKRQVEIYGSDEVITNTINRTSFRHSGVIQRAGPKDLRT